MTTDELDRIFSYATLTENQREITRRVFAGFHELAIVINGLCPESREKSLALTSLQTALLWCDAAIAIHGKDL